MRIRIVAAVAVIACASAGCGGISIPHTEANSAPTTPAVAATANAPAGAAPPAPVSTTASLTGNCVMGYEWTPNSTDAATGMFISGAPARGASDGDPALAYQLTLTNDSPVTADVGAFAVVFYSGTIEAGSDQEQASGFITPGQSLSWTIIEDHTVNGYGDDPNQQLAQTASIPAGAATCQLVQWYHQ